MEKKEKETVKIILTRDNPSRFHLPDCVTKIYTPEKPENFKKYKETSLTNTIEDDGRETWRLQSLLVFDLDTGIPSKYDEEFESKEEVVEMANEIARKKGKNVRFELKGSE